MYSLAHLAVVQRARVLDETTADLIHAPPRIGRSGNFEFGMVRGAESIARGGGRKSAVVRAKREVNELENSGTTRD